MQNWGAEGGGPSIIQRTEAEYIAKKEGGARGGEKGRQYRVESRWGAVGRAGRRGEERRGEEHKNTNRKVFTGTREYSQSK